MTINVLYTESSTLYGKTDKGSLPWGDDDTAITENVTYPGLYPTIATAPFIYLQAGGSPDATDTFLFDAREQHYGSAAGGDLFHQRRINAFDWEDATLEDKVKALYDATGMIDKFQFIGDKVVSTQGLEFPRDRTKRDDTVVLIGGTSGVPVSIENAAYLISDALIGGRDPQSDFDSLRVKSETIAGIRTEFESARVPSEHIANLVPSPAAWALIRPFLHIADSFVMNKA